MTAAMIAGAVPHIPVSWFTLNWQSLHRNVRRLQARIVKAWQEGRWGKVKAWQYLLTHSFSGRVIAVKRVTENPGKRTPGIDGIVWDTPEKKAQAVNSLRHRGYHPLPLRRVHIPKSNGKKRPLGILNYPHPSGTRPHRQYHGIAAVSTNFQSQSGLHCWQRLRG